MKTIKNHLNLFFNIFFAFLLLSLINDNLLAQAFQPDTHTGTTQHDGYVQSGDTGTDGKFFVYGSSWSHFIQLYNKSNTSIHGTIAVSGDGMLFRNYYTSSSYNAAFTFRNINDYKLFTIYNDASVNVGTIGYQGLPTGTKMRVIDGNYPSLMIAKSTTISGDISVAAGNTMYSNISEEDDFVVRASSGSLLLTSRTEGGEIKFATGDMDGATWLGDSEKMIITNAGNVGIGISNPANELEVNGKIRAKEVLVESTGWPDFVFSEGYKLKPLEEVETHINNNGHLPEIPSAEEIEENGIQVGEMQSKLLQKIEELTLYMIEINKENKTLKEKVALLENESL